MRWTPVAYIHDSQIVQDLSEGQECFLSDPRWRQFLSTEYASIVVDGPPGLRLRVKLCEFLVNIPGLVKQATKLLACLENRPGELQCTEILHQVLAMRNEMGTWYAQHVLPLLRAQLVPKEHAPLDHQATLISSIASTPKNQDLLLTITDSVANATIARLEQLALQLFGVLPHGRSLSAYDINLSTMQTRVAMALGALYRVQITNSMAAKPLEFGLKQLGCT